MPGTQRWTVRDVRKGNRAEVLRTLYFRGVSHRQEIVARTGLSAATVSNVTADLLADGVVIEAGLEESEGGRPRVLLRVDPEYRYLIGVDVGEPQVQVELFDLSMRPRERVAFPLPPNGATPEAVVRAVVAGVADVLARGQVELGRVLGVGVGVPGIVEHGPQEAVHARTLGWDRVPLQLMLAQGLRNEVLRGDGLRGDGPGLPILTDNAAKTMGQAELRFGGGRGARDAVLVLIGSGVGGCVVADGAPYQGTSGSAGEWGHTTIVVGGRLCRCGARGCLEAYIGAEAIFDRLREADPAAALALAEYTGVHAALAALVDAAARRDGSERAVLDETLTYLGAGLGSLINLFNPERIVVGGWAGLLIGRGRLDRIRAEAGRAALARPFSQTEITLGELGSDAVAMGAATLVLERFLGFTHSAAGFAPQTVTQKAVPQKTVPQKTAPQKTAPQKSAPQKAVTQKAVTQKFGPGPSGRGRKA
jgi:predicted NBD/HSP70 family sugar kinase